MLTDPVVLSRGDEFGATDGGIEAMEQWFANHSYRETVSAVAIILKLWETQEPGGSKQFESIPLLCSLLCGFASLGQMWSLMR